MNRSETQGATLTTARKPLNNSANTSFSPITGDFFVRTPGHDPIPPTEWGIFEHARAVQRHQSSSAGRTGGAVPGSVDNGRSKVNECVAGIELRSALPGSEPEARRQSSLRGSTRPRRRWSVARTYIPRERSELDAPAALTSRRTGRRRPASCAEISRRPAAGGDGGAALANHSRSYWPPGSSRVTTGHRATGQIAQPRNRYVSVDNSRYGAGPGTLRTR